MDINNSVYIRIFKYEILKLTKTLFYIIYQMSTCISLVLYALGL
jgi:hypothetical protein